MRSVTSCNTDTLSTKVTLDTTVSDQKFHSPYFLKSKIEQVSETLFKSMANEDVDSSELAERVLSQIHDIRTQVHELIYHEEARFLQKKIDALLTYVLEQLPTTSEKTQQTMLDVGQSLLDLHHFITIRIVTDSI